jgi:hypothetical protein
MDGKDKHVQHRPLDIEEIRLVADLRVMHAKVDELYQIVNNLKRRHDDSDVITYADQPVLSEDIQRVDEIYLFFVSLKEEAERRRRAVR